MIFVLLIAVTTALNFQSQESDCAYIVTQCEATAGCVGAEPYIDTCVAGFGIPSEYVLGVPSTAVAQAYAMCAMGVNVGQGGDDMTGIMTDLYECECEHAAGCSWSEASAIPVATSVCLQDPSCKGAWEMVVTLTTASGVIWDTASLGLQFPNATNNFDAYCNVMGTMQAVSNTKAMALGTALFSTAPGMDNGNDIIAYCNMQSAIGAAANACMQDTVTGCLATWNEVRDETTADGVVWMMTSLGIEFPMAEMRPDVLAAVSADPNGVAPASLPTQQSNADYCKVTFAVFEKENSLATSLGTTLFAQAMPAGVGDVIAAECNTIMKDEIMATVQKTMLIVVSCVAVGCIILSLFSAYLCFRCTKGRKETSV